MICCDLLCAEDCKSYGRFSRGLEIVQANTRCGPVTALWLRFEAQCPRKLRKSLSAQEFQRIQKVLHHLGRWSLLCHVEGRISYIGWAVIQRWQTVRRASNSIAIRIGATLRNSATKLFSPSSEVSFGSIEWTEQEETFKCLTANVTLHIKLSQWIIIVVIWLKHITFIPQYNFIHTHVPWTCIYGIHIDLCFNRPYRPCIFHNAKGLPAYGLRAFHCICDSSPRRSHRLDHCLMQNCSCKTYVFCNVCQRIHLWCVARARAPEEEKRNEECKVTTRMLRRKECLNTSDWHGVYTMRMALVVQKVLGLCLQQCLFSSPPCLPSFRCKRGSKVQI